jgi:hypothetical protein
MLPCEEMGGEIGLSTTLNNEEIRLEKKPRGQTSNQSAGGL